MSKLRTILWTVIIVLVVLANIIPKQIDSALDRENHQLLLQNGWTPLNHNRGAKELVRGRVERPQRRNVFNLFSRFEWSYELNEKDPFGRSLHAYIARVGSQLDVAEVFSNAYQSHGWTRYWPITTPYDDIIKDIKVNGYPSTPQYP